MNIIICFGKKRPPLNFGSKILMWFERFPASHVWIELQNEYSTYCYESVFPKSRKIEKTKHQEKYETVKEFVFSITDNNLLYQARQSIYQMMGIRYSILQLLVIGLGIVFKFLNRYISMINWNGDKKLICTELAAKFMHDVFAVDFGEKQDTISLRDVYRECLKLEQNSEYSLRG